MPPRVLRRRSGWRRRARTPEDTGKTRPKGYSFFVTLCNPDPTDTIYIYGGTVTSIQLRDLVVAFLVPPVPFPIAPVPGCVTVEYVASSNNSADFSFTVDVEVLWGHTPLPPDPDNHPPVAFKLRCGRLRPGLPVPADLTARLTSNAGSGVR